MGIVIISKSINNDKITKNKLNIIDEKTKKSVKTIYSIVRYKDYIYALTKKNIIKININNKSDIKTYRNSLGVSNIDLSYASSRIYGSNIYINSTQGIYILDLDKLSHTKFSASVKITEISLNNEVINQGYEEINETEIGRGRIKFNFSSLDYQDSKSSTFKYRLEGFDKEWIETNNNYAVYSNLHPGSYTFNVRGTNTDGVWSNKITKFNITVKTAIIHYVIALLFIIIVLLIVFYFYSGKKQIKLLDKKAHIDTLTQLSNRLDFQRTYEREFHDKKNNFALIVIDLDHFKDINDAYGHSTGDQYIKNAAKRMLSSVRDRDYVARLGGDEFVIIINKFKLQENLNTISKRLQNILSEPYLINNQEIKGSASMGVAIYPQNGSTHEELFIHADAAMYQAKEYGRNQVVFFDKEIKEKLNKSIKIKSLLGSALSNNEFEMYYQPKINTSNKKVYGFEALIRWIHPTEGFIPPDEFISEAERTGTITEIGEWIINNTCNQISIWNKMGFTGNIAINISAIQLTKGNIVQSLKDALETTGINPSSLEVEITESSLIENIEKSTLILNQIKSLGVSIALDDFGTGYSSLSYLTKFPIDTLKIDRSFIEDAEKEKNSFHVLENIYSLAAKLGMTVVAEGIETKSQEEMLKEFDDHLLQGFLYSKPLPQNKLENIIKDGYIFD